jgi:hypothetical protein
MMILKAEIMTHTLFPLQNITTPQAKPKLLLLTSLNLPSETAVAMIGL